MGWTFNSADRRAAWICVSTSIGVSPATRAESTALFALVRADSRISPLPGDYGSLLARSKLNAALPTSARAR